MINIAQINFVSYITTPYLGCYSIMMDLVVSHHLFKKYDSSVKPLQFRPGFIRYYVFAPKFFFHPLYTF
jgi:hypothetical protein